ncbi:hypothetical protein SISSUDRAFT_1031996 [Sistotremastrum suecicum HHB10207 ss-3]|uniref:F-box domain-containing protein n=1 Tax=Sistotremastrum suecicum HHB10207 ss-3 TaxID=1314776 RepID=A0A166F5B4_9AGAM|nr:hypothetical protein SISSUDRAFT_1031996 [Sistotremastrum suecicum HHB10207 ss-3]
MANVDVIVLDQVVNEEFDYELQFLADRLFFIHTRSEIVDQHMVSRGKPIAPQLDAHEPIATSLLAIREWSIEWNLVAGPGHRIPLSNPQRWRSHIPMSNLFFAYNRRVTMDAYVEVARAQIMAQFGGNAAEEAEIEALMDPTDEVRHKKTGTDAWASASSVVRLLVRARGRKERSDGDGGSEIEWRMDSRVEASILQYFDDIPDAMRTILQRGCHLAVCVESGWGLEEMLFTLKPDDDSVSPPLVLLERGPEDRIAHYEEDLTQNWFFGVNDTIGRLAHYFPLSQLLSFSCKFTDFGPRVGGGLGWEPLFRELRSLERLEMAGLHYLDYISTMLSPKPDGSVFCPALRIFKIIGKTIPLEPSVIDMFRLRKSCGHMVTELIFTPYDWDELLQLPIDSVDNYREMLSYFEEHVGVAKTLVLHSSNSIFAWKSRHDLLEYEESTKNLIWGYLFELDFGRVAEAGADCRAPLSISAVFRLTGSRIVFRESIKAPANARIRLSSLEFGGQMEDIVLSSSNAGSSHGSLSPQSQSHALRRQQNCPALRLPNEIVGEIFEWTVRANQDFDTFYGTNNRVSFKHTMALSQICVIWRAFALGTRSIWTYILVIWPLPVIDTFYSQSNSAPLNLVWHNEYHHWHDSTMDQRGDLVLERIPELASLRIMGVEASPGDNLYQTMVAVLRRPLPRTTFIHITFPFSKPGNFSDSLFMGSAPSLTSLSLFNILGPLASITFAGLRVLRLHYADRQPGSVETVELFDLIDLLCKLPYLEFLQFARSSDAAAIVCNHELPLEELEARHLHTLILDGLESSAISSVLSCVELPSLERIKLATCPIEPGRLLDEDFPHSTLLRYLQDNVPENVRKIQQQSRHLGLRVDSGSWYEEVSISIKPNDDPDASDLASDIVFPPMVVFERGLEVPFHDDQQDVWLRGVDDTIGRLARYFPVSQLLSFSFKFTDFKFRFTGGQGWEPLFRELISLEKIELSCPNHLVNICSILSPRSDGSVFCPSLRTFQILGWKVPHESSVINMFRMRKACGYMVTQLIFTPYDSVDCYLLDIDSVNNCREMLASFKEYVGSIDILECVSSNSIFDEGSGHCLLESEQSTKDLFWG